MITHNPEAAGYAQRIARMKEDGCIPDGRRYVVCQSTGNGAGTWLRKQA